MVLWEARRRPGNGAAELIGVIFGCCCVITVVALVFWVEFRQLQLIMLAVVFGAALTVRAIGSLRGRVVLHPDTIEVRVLRTRHYRWASLRSVELIEGRIEITPHGWVRRLPIPADRSAEAYATIMDRWHPGPTGQP